jgi:hypothetical protein
LDAFVELPTDVRHEVVALIWELIACAPGDAPWFFKEAGLAEKTIELCRTASDELTNRVLWTLGTLLRWMDAAADDKKEEVVQKLKEQWQEWEEWVEEAAATGWNSEMAAHAKSVRDLVWGEQERSCANEAHSHA